MRWTRISNFIVASILSFAYAITTLLNIIGPLHISTKGHITPLSSLAIFSVIYFISSLIITWSLYFYLRNKPQLLFFILIFSGITIIIGENFLWANYSIY